MAQLAQYLRIVTETKARDLTASGAVLIHLCESSVGSLPQRLPDLEELYIYYNICKAAPHSMSTREVLGHLEQQMANLVSTDDSDAESIEDFIDVLIAQSEVDECDLTAALLQITVVRNSLQSHRVVSPELHPDRWRHCLSLVQDHLRISPTTDFVIRDRPRAVGRAVRMLRKRGVPATLLGKRGYLDEHANQIYCARIGELARRIGGLRYADLLFSSLQKLGAFDQESARYSIGRNPKGILGGAAASSLPVGYLLNIAARHFQDLPQANIKKDELTDLWREINELCTYRCALLDLEPYSIFESLNKTGDDLLQYLRELVLFDGLFAFPQCPPGDVRDKILVLLKQETSLAESKLGFSIDQAAEFIDYFVNVPSHSRSYAFELTNLAKRFANWPPRTIAALVGTFAMPAETTNHGYEQPTHLSKATFPLKKPLVQLRVRKDIFSNAPRTLLAETIDIAPALAAVMPDDTVIYVPNQFWSAAGCVDALIERLRTVDKGIPERVGMAMEIHIRETLTRAGATAIGGKYRSSEDSKEYDCDGLIQSNEHIILIESKKRDFSRDAREGSELDIAVDLADSMIKGQLQLARQELELRVRGDIVLSGNRVPLNSRAVERVVVSLADHGALHSRIVTMDVLRVFASGTFSAKGNLTNAQSDKLKRLNVYCAELGRVESLIATHCAKDHRPFYNCWFLPLQFIEQLAAQSSSTETFVKSLRTIKATVNGQMDVFREHKYWSALASITATQ